jgi:hypothetical protein
MFPDLPVPSTQTIPRIGSDHALASDFPQATGGTCSIDSFLAKLNDAELRLLRDNLRRVQARVFASRAIRTLFAQFGRDALEELADSLD